VGLVAAKVEKMVSLGTQVMLVPRDALATVRAETLPPVLQMAAAAAALMVMERTVVALTR
jgi:uncharacterized membrane protein YagU involved in acid resistance